MVLFSTKAVPYSLPHTILPSLEVS